jgi:hypothetical protein
MAAARRRRCNHVEGVQDKRDDKDLGLGAAEVDAGGLLPGGGLVGVVMEEALVVDPGLAVREAALATTERDPGRDFGTLTAELFRDVGQRLASILHRLKIGAIDGRLRPQPMEARLS